MDKLEFFARKNNLKLKSSATGEYSICGREARIRVRSGDLAVELYDQTCIPGKARHGFIRILLFNPDDAPAANLALEVIETVGQEELTTDERRKKVKLLRRLRKSEILRSFAQKHGLKLQPPERGPLLQAPERGPFILGRAGSIFLTDGHLGILVTDQSCVQDPVVEDLLDIPIFNPADELQSKLALEVIETTGQKELTRDERKTKVELLEQLRMAEPQENGCLVLATFLEKYPSITRET